MKREPYISFDKDTILLLFLIIDMITFMYLFLIQYLFIGIIKLFLILPLEKTVILPELFLPALLLINVFNFFFILLYLIKNKLLLNLNVLVYGLYFKIKI